jgi:uncharacterized protein (DUF2141 family)
MKTIPFAAIIFTGIFIGVLFAQSPLSMTVQVNGLKEHAGQLMVAVYNTADAFPSKSKEAIAVKKVPVTSSTMNVLLENIPEGTYAVAVYHDENSNGKLDFKWYGAPDEGTGASRDAQGSFGPPSFDDAKFEFKNSTDTVKISIHY